MNILTKKRKPRKRRKLCKIGTKPVTSKKPGMSNDVHFDRFNIRVGPTITNMIHIVEIIAIDKTNSTEKTKVAVPNTIFYPHSAGHSIIIKNNDMVGIRV